MEHNHSPLVSICIPSYNCDKYIKECINSVFQQSYKNIELIITDDASTDDSVNIIKETISLAPLSVRVIFKQAHENLGLAGNWNLAMSLATGDYIKILPCDDYISEDCIEKQVNLFQSNKHISLVYCKRNIINKSGKQIITTGYTPAGIIKSRDLIVKCILNGTNVIGEPGAVLFDKQASEKIGDFNGDLPYLIDLDYWSRLLRCGDAMAINEALVVFRIDQNLSVRLGAKRVLQFNRFIEQLSSTWKISSTTIVLGKTRAYINEILRRMFYIYSKFK